jgi:predicted transcriptional regulator
VLNEAIDAYLDVQEWQIQHIQEGMRQAEAGEFASDAEVAAAFSRWRK